MRPGNGRLKRKRVISCAPVRARASTATVLKSLKDSTEWGALKTASFVFFEVLFHFFMSSVAAGSCLFAWLQTFGFFVKPFCLTLTCLTSLYRKKITNSDFKILLFP